MNALTHEDLSARQMPFETLDTTSRSLSRRGGDVLISDTVGFIRRLPQSLLGSFESTLSEIHEASLLVVVVDGSDYEWNRHVDTTQEMLGRLGVLDTPRFYVFNKADRMQENPEEKNFSEACQDYPYVVLSSHDPSAVGRLKETLLKVVRKTQNFLDVFVPFTAGRIMSQIHSECQILESETTERGFRMTIGGDPSVLSTVMHRLQELGDETPTH